jgi:hypothetical protein
VKVIKIVKTTTSPKERQVPKKDEEVGLADMGSTAIGAG